MSTFTIGQLARQAGVNLETIRFYERRGLLPEPPRTRSGYRQYSPADLWRLQFISRAKQLGFTLAEISNLVGREDGGSAEDILLMARTKLEALEDRERALADTISRLERLVDLCEESGGDDCRGLRVIG
jgi:MerR family transcriptional regulator, copper efflux regulator